MIQYSGVLKDGAGLLLTGTQGVMFALYRDQEGGSPLWVETQNVQADEQGRFAVLLGAKTTDGVAVDLFSTSESRWLGVQLQAPDAAEQPRVLLVSVPYALKAADAETLGGKPMSAFLLAAPEDNTGAQAPSTIESGKRIVNKAAATMSGAAVSGTGTVNKLTKWSDTNGTLVDSSIFDNGNVGIGTTTPLSNLDVSGTAQLHGAGNQIGLVVNNTGNVGIGTATTNQRFNVQMPATSGVFDGGTIGTYSPAATFSNPITGLGQNTLLQFSNGSTNDNFFGMVGNGSGYGDFVFAGYAGAYHEWMRITAAGNVGIGTTNPIANLTLADSVTQSGNLQEWQDNSGNRLASLDPAGTFTGPLGTMLVHGSFVQATGADLGSASFIPSDTLLEAQTGAIANSIDDTVGGVLDATNLSRTQTLIEGLDRKGSFITARVRWNSASIVSTHTFYVLAGGAKSTSTANTPLLTSSASNGIYEGFGFEALGTALKGITVAAGTATVVDLATTLSTGGGAGSFVEVMAVRGALSVQFYVNGTYKGCISATTLSGCTTSNSGTLPSTAASTYEVRTQNETSGTATNAIAQVGFLTVGIPRP